MKVATFNLFQYAAPGTYWYERDERNTYTLSEWQQKNTWIRQQLSTLDTDIIGFQEVFSHHELQDLCQSLGYHFFAIVDLPGVSPEDLSVFTRPIVALASRMPLQQIRTPKIDKNVQLELGLTEEFGFSRLPVCADINVPDIGTVTIYVLHLKSKRASILEVTYLENVSWQERSRDTLLRLSRGNITSLLQRGAESTLVYHSVSAELAPDAHKPIIVLGDLNDDPQSTTLAALTMQERVFSIGGIDSAFWPEGTGQYLHDYRLADTFRLAPNMRQSVRPYTHLHRGTAICLDHILVSNALNSFNANALAEVMDYKVLNAHLGEDGINNKLQSDHGIVAITLIPTRDQQHAPHTGQPIPYAAHPNQLTTRQDFIDLAGGIYQSSKHYEQWTSQDKWDNFWSFFFDKAYGWIPTIYGSVPVSELYQKQRHSIEHIVPLDFLDRYLTLKQQPRQIRYGASTNPLNFAPSERGLNAKRSNFAFDFEGDRIVRPFNLDLNPELFERTGFDADNEWVIPSRNRGDVARAILYMLLVYGIDELYQRHIDTLVHWAKVDSPSAWELAYNQWVYDRLGIRNPLIDTPDKCLPLLNNRQLMHAMLLKTDI